MSKGVRGRFDNWRIGLAFFTLPLFYGGLWLDWNGRQALLRHLFERKFYIFGLVFWPQDVIYLAALLIDSPLALFLVTAIAGRMFCGYSSPQRAGVKTRGPYARFQSVMFDPDTLIVSYDPARGENRGIRKKGVDAKATGLGDCIDCNLCVQVCPTGIDIRNGLQYEGIGCAASIENVYLLQIMNTEEWPHRYKVTVDGIKSAEIADETEVSAPAATLRSFNTIVRVAPDAGQPGANPLHFKITALDNPAIKIREKASFLRP